MQFNGTFSSLLITRGSSLLIFHTFLRVVTIFFVVSSRVILSYLIFLSVLAGLLHLVFYGRTILAIIGTWAGLMYVLVVSFHVLWLREFTTFFYLLFLFLYFLISFNV